jgi:Subtilase family
MGARGVVLGAVLVIALPAGSASARWSRIARAPSGSAPYFACPADARRMSCQLIVDPTSGSRRRGPLREGEITRGPVADTSPALYGHGVEGGYSPEDLRNAYGLASSASGSGQTIAVVDAFDDPNAEADLQGYRSAYGISSCTTGNGCFRKVNQTGGTSYPPPDAGWAGEISVDLDMASAICPNCHILLVEAAGETRSAFATAENEAASLGATEISNSFGAEEASEAPQLASAYHHPGVPITAAGGDHGYGVSTPAANPHVIAVGGTSLVPASNTRGWAETSWYGTLGGEVWATGSGCSEEPKPGWQLDGGCPFRTANDVAAVADLNTPVSVYDSYKTPHPWQLAGGTSVSAPIIAGAMALATPYTKSLDGAQALYLEAFANGGQALDDVTSGSNGSCGTYLCEAGPGYDGPTGLGSVYGIPEVSAGQVRPPAAATQTASAVTQTTATLNATVNPNGGSITRCVFELGGSGAFIPCAALPAPGQSPQAVSAPLRGLLAGATYVFRIVATNPSGTSYGEFQSFATLPAAPPSLGFSPPAESPGAGSHGPVVNPAAVLASTSLRASSAGVVLVKVRCPPGAGLCTGTITLRTMQALGTGSGHGSTRRVITLATASFRIAGGRTMTVKLHLRPAVRRLLRRYRHLHVRALIVSHGASGAAYTAARAVTIYAPR